ncbi:MAG: phosphodiester glycosidase family protein [Rhizobiaceae bacterium]
MNSVRTVLIGGLIAFALLAAALFWILRGPTEIQSTQSKLPVSCDEVSFAASDYIVCTINPARHTLKLALNDPAGKPWGSLDRFARANPSVLFAMNAGMYHEDLSPVGLYVEGGRQIAPLNVADATGNFYMKPNGVFGVTPDGKPFVIGTDVYALAKMPVAYATQSGPMLVIDGAVHPRFEPDGESRFTRNGAGIDDQGRAVFAISRAPVSFGAFARLFKDRLNCKNALYFDGFVSAFSDGESTIEGSGQPAGPIVSVWLQ